MLISFLQREKDRKNLLLCLRLPFELICLKSNVRHLDWFPVHSEKDLMMV